VLSSTYQNAPAAAVD